MAFQYKRRSIEELERREKQQGGEFVKFTKDEYRTWAPPKGDNNVRILPPTFDDAKHYGMDVWTHYSVGPEKASVLCPFRMERKPCPLCQARAAAEARGDEDEMKALKPARRVLAWIINRKDEKEGPLLWPMAWTLDRDIAKVSRDKELGTYYVIDDPTEGYDVYFDRDGEGITTKYTGIQVARRPSSVNEKWVDYVAENPLPDTLLHHSYEEIKNFYEGNATPKTENKKIEPTKSREPEPEQKEEVKETKSEHKEEPPFETDKPPVETKSTETKSSTAETSTSGKSRADILKERFLKK